MNPYKVAERIGRIVGYVILAAFIALAIWAVVWRLLAEGWGWNVLWLIPGIPVALAIFLVVVGLIVFVGTWVEDKWRDGKYAWDRKRRVKS